MSKKILYITQEIMPYLPSSQISKNCRHLPQAIQEKGQEIRTFMPKFGSINERRNQLHEVIRLSGMNLIINDSDHPLIIKVASIQSARMQIYFIDNEDYFKRKATVADDKGQEFKDNDERSIFFIRGVLETVKKLRWIPDVIDCHGWMAALTGLYLKTVYADDPCFKDSKVIYSVYNDEFNQSFNSNFIEKLKFDGITDKEIINQKDPIGYEALSDIAIKYADGIIQSEEVVNQAVLEKIKNSKKKYLPHIQPTEEAFEAINNFYENL